MELILRWWKIEARNHMRSHRIGTCVPTNHFGTPGTIAKELITCYTPRTVEEFVDKLKTFRRSTKECPQVWYITVRRNSVQMTGTQCKQIIENKHTLILVESGHVLSFGIGYFGDSTKVHA